MPRLRLVCSTIVSAFQLHLFAAPALAEDVPLPLAVAVVAERAGIDPERNRARFMADLAQALYASPDARSPVVAGAPRVAVPENPAAPLTIPVPLPLPVWESAVFGHLVPSNQLVATIVQDRRAMLLCRGLSGLDDDTLAYLVEHPSIVTLLYQRGAPVFAVFGSSLHIHQGRVVTPGGREFEPLWQGAVEAPLDRPDLFIRRVFIESSGRLAYLLDTLDAARPDAVRFAMGAWLPSAIRHDRFKALVYATLHSYREWRPDEYPFSRPIGDLAMLLLRVRLDGSSAPSAPAGRDFWGQVFDAGDKQSPIESVDAAWLMSTVGERDMYTRLDQLDQFSFGQRVFSAVDPETRDLTAGVLRSFGRYRMLFNALERIGIRAPVLYEGAVKRAETLGELPSHHRFWTVAQFQGALAFVVRLRRAGAIDAVRGAALVQSLVALPTHDAAYRDAAISWWRSQIGPLLPQGGSWEERAIEAASGPTSRAERQRLHWEGQLYVVDLAFAERQRMNRVRAKQGGLTIDVACALDDVVHQLREQALTLAGVRAAEQALRRLMTDAASVLRDPPVHLLPAGVPVQRDGLELIAEATQSLARIIQPGDLRRVDAIAVVLQQLGERAFAEALVSLAYAADLGDPDGAPLLAGNVALRHDFGFGRRDTDARLRVLWALPRPEVQPGVPWHMTGSLLGLDIGLAPFSLRRMSMDRVADAPKLSSIEREALAVSVALLEPDRLTDPDRDQLAAAVTRGKARVEALTTDTKGFDTIADELGLDGFRRRSLTHALQAAPWSLLEQFTIGDLMMLGSPQLTDLDAWGQPGFHSAGCVCTTYSPSRAWRVLEGRAQLPVVTATMGDLNLAMAIMLRDLGVPTSLHKSVLALAMQEIIDGLGANGDWWGLSRAARSITQQKLEDYVSGATVIDGPLVPIDEASALPR